MGIFEKPGIDCHVRVLDPARFPYGTNHVLLVQPNSGHGDDDSCMLDAIGNHPDLFKDTANC